MADHSKPTTTSTYVNFVSELDGRLDDISVGLDPAVTTATNLATNSIRWTSASNKWQKYNGTTWNDLSSAYSININGTVGATTPASGAFTTLSATGNVTLGDASGDTVTINGTVGAGVVISGSTATDALRITQTGVGNALVVEDSTNPDSTPFVVDASGNVGIGTTSTLGNSLLNVSLGVVARNSGATNGYFQFYNENAGTDLKTWRVGNISSGALRFETVNDAYSSATERMRIDSSGNVGIGTTVTPSYILDIQPSATATDGVFVGRQRSSGAGTDYRHGYFVRRRDNASNTGYGMWMSTDTSGSYYWENLIIGAAGGGSNIVFCNSNSISPTERMRIDYNGNVGIGTSSPNSYANGLAVYSASNPSIAIASGNANAYLRLFTTSDNNMYLTNTGGSMTMVTAGTERMRIDSSGNVGIGTTSPSTYGKFVVQDSGNGSEAWFRSNGNNSAINLDNYGTGGVCWGIGSTGNVAAIGTGKFRISYNTSGSIGVQGTDALVIDSSGNVGIGTSSPAYKLNVYDATNSSVFVQGNATANIVIQRSSTDSTGPQFGVRKTRGTVASPTAITSGDSAGTMLFQVYGGTNYRNIAYIAGNVDTYTSDTDISGNMRFYTSPSGSAAAIERMRIDSSGNLLVNTTNITSAKINVLSPAGGIGYCARVSTNGDYGMAFQNSGGTTVGSIAVNASTTAYNTSSDYRLKTEIQPMQNGLQTINALKPSTYKWKIDNSYGEGFIAHELQSIIPEAVTGEKDAVDEEGNIKPQGVDYSKIVVHLVAAIQELKAELDALKGAK